MEDHFKNKLKKVKVEWDKEQLWEELEPKLPKKKTGFYWRGLILLTLLGMTTCWSLQKNKPGIEVDSNLISNQNTSTNKIYPSSENNLKTSLPTAEEKEKPLANNQKDMIKRLPGNTIKKQATKIDKTKNKTTDSNNKKPIVAELTTKNNNSNIIARNNNLSETIFLSPSGNKNAEINSTYLGNGEK